jgi:protein tyrosine phosphatase (PTP) superfamily phosphohydrolase (DUF442 family)
MRWLYWLFLFVAVGCQTSRTVSFGPPGTAACNRCESRYTPVIPAPPPVVPSLAPPLSEPNGVPPVLSESPAIRLGEPRVKVQTQSPPPTANVPGPGELSEEPSPIDLPGFTPVRPGVASGLQPFPDGQEWLARKGYKSVLHLRGPLEDTAAISRQYEKKRIAYSSIVVSPATLTKEKVDEFALLVEDASKHPLYVFDRDGAAAGALWYLYYRLYLKADDDKARKEAARLGLREDDEEQKTYWVAIQNLLKNVEP